MSRFGTLAVLAGTVALGVVVARHLRGASSGHDVPGGIVMNDARVYDVLTGFVLGPFYSGIAADVASVVPAGARILEVGCGPGHLASRLARTYGFDVTGLDLDPAMIERARANARRASVGEITPSFVVGDVGSLPFPDGSFDVVVSTLSMHHWSEPALGLAEVARVLRADGRALVWDLRPGTSPHPFARRHDHAPAAVQDLHAVGLRAASTRPWRWPWRLSMVQRMELVCT